MFVCFFVKTLIVHFQCISFLAGDDDCCMFCTLTSHLKKEDEYIITTTIDYYFRYQVVSFNECRECKVKLYMILVLCVFSTLNLKSN